MKKLIYIFLFVILTLPNFGQYWEKQTNIPLPYNSGYYLDIFFLPSNTNYVWACGFDGYVIRSTDYGQTWSGSTIADPAYHLESIHFVNQNVGFVSGVEGVWKTTDGGANFTEITPLDSAIRGFWGCYFLDENIGVVVGGGCDDLQRFYKTTNGGGTWTLKTYNQPSTGLTDLILYSDGTGYAVSSGQIWKTTNTGSDWFIFKGTGATVWQEEISILGNSIVLPFAGITCSGQGNAGGAMFSTDFGNTWKVYNMGFPIFGACLVDANSAWACGYGKSIYYTSNSGTSWKMMNCGINSGDLDDITFLSEEEGWVCGKGIYKLNITKISNNKDQLSFAELCYPETRLDSIKIINKSFYNASLQVQLTNNVDNAFEIVYPSFTSSVNSCDSVGVAVRFSPKTKKVYNAKLVITAISEDGKTTFFKEIDLLGTGNKTTIRPETDIVIVDSVACGYEKFANLKWFSDAILEQIKSVAELNNDKDQINFVTDLPLTVNPIGTNTGLSIKLIDTGWSEQLFKFKLLPCSIDTIVKVRAYGYSPIINSIDSLHFVSTCSGKIRKVIPVWNTGNSNLIISKNLIANNPTEVKIIGWSSGKSLPIKITPKQADSIIIEIDVINEKSQAYILQLHNNDKTLTRGNKEIIDILLVAKMMTENVSAHSIIDFGRVCLNGNKDTIIIFENKGNIFALLEKIDGLEKPYELLLPWNAQINPNESINVKCVFNGEKVGIFIDTLKLKTGSCKELQILFVGEVVFSDFEINPTLINEIIKKNESKVIDANIANTGNTDLSIVKYTLKPPATDIEITYDNSFPFLIANDQYFNFKINIKSLNNTSYKGELCFTAYQECYVEKCIPIEISSISRFVTFGNNSSFSQITCDGYAQDTILIVNKGTISDTITNISLNGDKEFSLVNLVTLPYSLPQNDSMKIIIEFNSQLEGVFSTFLNITTLEPEGKLLPMPISMDFKKSIISIDTNFIDFGIFEVCDISQSKSIRITNTGLLDNIIDISPSNLQNYYEILPSLKFYIEPSISRDLTINFHPDKTKQFGIFYDTLSLTSSNCPQYFSIILKYEIINPKLTYTNRNIDFGIIEAEESDLKQITITNNSTVTRTINLIKPLSLNEFKLLTEFPITFAPGESKLVEFEYTSLVAGSFLDSIIIEEYSSCRDTILIKIKAHTPEEFYSAKVWIDNYSANVGDAIDIHIKMSPILEKLHPTKLSTTISFDPYLFYPQKVFYNANSISKSYEYSYSFGNLLIELNKDEADEMLTRDTILFTIEGKVLASDPPYTDLTITNFEIETNKNYTLQKENGLLTLLPFCVPEVSHKLIIYPEPTMQINVLDNEINFEFDNISHSEKLNIYNSIGVNIAQFEIYKQTKTYNINSDRLANGIYFVRFDNKIFKIIINK